jgi:hypothetical protein
MDILAIDINSTSVTNEIFPSPRRCDEFICDLSGQTDPARYRIYWVFVKFRAVFSLLLAEPSQFLQSLHLAVQAAGVWDQSAVAGKNPQALQMAAECRTARPGGF